MVHSKLRQLMYDSQTCTHTHTHTHTHTQHTKSYYLQLQATQEEDVSSLFKLESKHVQVLSSKTLLPQAPSNQIEPLSTKDYGRSIAKQVTPGSHQLNDKVFTMHKGVLLWFHMGEHPGNPPLVICITTTLHVYIEANHLATSSMHIASCPGSQMEGEKESLHGSLALLVHVLNLS